MEQWHEVYLADISAYSGSVEELGICVSATTPFSMVSVGVAGIEFSTVVVPEPSMFVLFALGMTALVLQRGRIRRRNAPV